MSEYSVYMTYDTYDKILTAFESACTENKLTPDDYVPPKEDIDRYFLPYIAVDESKLCFLLWIDAEGIKTPENENARAYLSRVIKENVYLGTELPPNMTVRKRG